MSSIRVDLPEFDRPTKRNFPGTEIISVAKPPALLSTLGDEAILSLLAGLPEGEIFLWFLGNLSGAAELSCADHLLSNYLEKLELFTVLNKMPAAVVEKCEKAWYELTSPVKARLVASLEGGGQTNPNLTFKQVLHPNFEKLAAHFADELSEMSMTVADLEIMLRKASLNVVSSKPVEVVSYSGFLSCCYKMFYDPDKETRERRLEKGRFMSIFRTYDVDFDRFLSPSEFSDLCSCEFPEMSPSDVRAVGEQLDIDLDGQISEREFLIWGLVGGVVNSIKKKRRDSHMNGKFQVNHRKASRSAEMMVGFSPAAGGRPLGADVEGGD